MTADLEAVTRDKLARWLLDFRYEGRVGWEELGDETRELLRGKADQAAAVLVSLPDDRLAEAEAKVARVEALHRPDGGVSGPGAMCVECTPDFGTPFEDPVSWPCPTIAALSDKGEDAC